MDVKICPGCRVIQPPGAAWSSHPEWCPTLAATAKDETPVAITPDKGR